MSSVLKVPPCSVSEVGPEFQIRPALPRKLTLLNLIPLVMKKGCWHFDNHNHIISVLSPQTENCCVFVTFGLAFLICRGKGAMLNCHVKYRSPEGTNQTLGLERAFLIFSSPRRRGSGCFSNWLQSSTSPQSILQMWPLSERPLRWIPLKTSSYTEFTINEQQPSGFYRQTSPSHWNAIRVPKFIPNIHCDCLQIQKCNYNSIKRWIFIVYWAMLHHSETSDIFCPKDSDPSSFFFLLRQTYFLKITAKETSLGLKSGMSQKCDLKFNFSLTCLRLDSLKIWLFDMEVFTWHDPGTKVNTIRKAQMVTYVTDLILRHIKG